MRVFHVLLLLFFTVPLAEIWVLLSVGSAIGALPTVAAVVFTAVLGAALIRAQGIATLSRVQASLDRGEIPALEMMEGAFLLVAGALLLTPGFITDSIGFACLVPPLRRALILHFLQSSVVVTRTEPATGRRTDAIEGEFRRLDD